MRSQNDPNVFTSEFLHLLDTRDHNGETCGEAEYAGPWRVVELGEQRFAVVHAAESTDSPPAAVFTSRETAALVAGLYPVLGRPGHYTLADENSEDGFAVRYLFDGDLQTIGFARYHHPELLEALHVAEWFLRSPDALARLLEAACHEVVARAGRLVADRLGKEAAA